jgi:hypothetical protein
MPSRAKSSLVIQSNIMILNIMISQVDTKLQL